MCMGVLFSSHLTALNPADLFSLGREGAMDLLTKLRGLALLWPRKATGETQ